MGLSPGAKGSGRSTGPREGLGAGQGNPGEGEGTKFNPDRLRARELNPGDIVGTLPSGEEAPRGETALPVRQVTAEALQRMAERVANEPLPAEYREQVLRYMELLKGSADTEGKGGETSPKPKE